MTTAVRLLGATCVVASIAACGDGGGGGGDAEAELQALVEDLLDGFLAGDADEVAGLFSEECQDIENDAEAAIQDIEGLGGDVQYNLTGVDVQNLTGDSAEVLPEGSAIFDGEEGPLTDPGEEYSRVVKEDGAWKFADCDFFAAEDADFGPTPTAAQPEPE